jgi:3-hydroxybutyryl-CoA dehydrogenase
MTNDAKVAILGVGMMGPGIAACSALAGHPTVLIGRDPERASHGVEAASENIKQLFEHDLVGPEQAERGISLLSGSSDFAGSCKTASLIIEAVSEDLALKQKIFKEIDELAQPGTIITSNTSGLRITDIARLAANKERMATTHFWYPGHLVPLVEIVMSEHTREEVARDLHALLTSWNKAPVIVRKDLPGQLANRILQAVIREAVNIVQTGLASAEDVDTAVKMGMGIRFPVWGPLEHIDAVGLDLAVSVQRDVLPGLNNRAEPPRLLEDLVAAGSLGYKSGKGLYDWHMKDMDRLKERRDRFIIQSLKHLREESSNGR